MNSGQIHPHWQSLLVWLNKHGMDTSPETMLVQARSIAGAGYGLFALRSIEAGTQICSIPSSALLNITTLSPHYPGSRRLLSATQLISLHLFLYRPAGIGASPDPLFGPYISTLPRNIDSHPLTWMITKEKHKLGSTFLPMISTSVMCGLYKLRDRFHSDWRTVQKYLQDTDFKHPISDSTQPVVESFQCEPSRCIEDYLWAWLIVNTRCLYHRLEQSPSNQNNMTLCPIVDFANHTPFLNSMSPQRPEANTTVAPPKLIGRNFTIISPSNSTIEGHELYLTYGAHSNRTLFVDYGFVNDVSKEDLLSGEVSGECDVQGAIEPLFEARGKLGAWMKEVLVDEGYWGDWTLHTQPAPAHPSYRLITALRLYHLFPASTKEVPPKAEAALLPWRDTLLGIAEQVSEENEARWRDTLLQICSALVEGATSAIASYEGPPESEDNASWLPYMRKNIRILWEEELCVANAVAGSIQDGEEF